MKVKMLEYYQGADVLGRLDPGQEVEVDDKLGEYLLMHRKAVLVAVTETPAPVYEEPVIETPRKRGKK